MTNLVATSLSSWLHIFLSQVLTCFLITTNEYSMPLNWSSHLALHPCVEDTTVKVRSGVAPSLASHTLRARARTKGVPCETTLRRKIAASGTVPPCLHAVFGPGQIDSACTQNKPEYPLTSSSALRAETYAVLQNPGYVKHVLLCIQCTVMFWRTACWKHLK